MEYVCIQQFIYLCLYLNKSFILPDLTQSCVALALKQTFLHINKYTVCPESSDPAEKILNLFASENEVYTIY